MAFESELNNDRQQADAGIFGVDMGGQLNSDKDVDVFKFTTSSPIVLNLKFSGDATSFSLKLFDSPTATVPVYTNQNGIGFTNFVKSIPPGTYYVEVSAGDQYSSSQYNLLVSALPSEAAFGEIEFNDTQQFADPILIGTTAIASLNSEQDRDFFSFDVDQRGKYSLAFDAPATASAGGYEVSIWDARGVLQSSQKIGSDLTYEFLAPVEGLYFVSVEVGGSFNPDQYSFHINSFLSIESILNGSAANDELLGTFANDRINGSTGNDIIIGADGNDSLDGGAGNDRMQGGRGHDVYVLDTVRDVVVELAGQGTDTLRTPFDIKKLVDNVENVELLASSIKVTGNALNNKLTGNGLTNSLTGLDGNDTLDGGLGADKMQGGRGNDSYKIDNIGDKVSESGNGGFDTVMVSMDLIKPINNIEHFILEGNARLLNGNAKSNLIEGSDNPNRLNGLAGDDLIWGEAGNDVLSGGNGNDFLDGGIGADLLIFDSKLSATANVDTVMNFEVELDKLGLSKSVFGRLAKGDLPEDQLYAYTGSMDGRDNNDYLLFNQSTGELYYDKDGIGKAAPVLFAKIEVVAQGMFSADNIVIL